MKKTFFLLLLGMGLYAQETLPTYQQYLLDGQYLFNPAQLGSTDYLEASAHYHKQFSKLEQSPSVQSLALHANVFDRVGAGVYLFRDQNGALSANGVAVGASYFIPLSDEPQRQDQFSFGASLNLYNTHIDYHLLNPRDARPDPLLQEQPNSTFLAYTNLGLAAKYRGLYAGISLVDLPLSSRIAIVNGIEPAPTKLFTQIGYEWNFAQNFALEPSVLANFNTNSSRMIDLNLLAKIKDEDRYLSLGVSYRTAKTSVGSTQLSLSPLLKVKLNQLTIGAMYQFALSPMAPQAGNAFLLSLGYQFENFINPRGFRYR